MACNSTKEEGGWVCFIANCLVRTLRMIRRRLARVNHSPDLTLISSMKAAHSVGLSFRPLFRWLFWHTFLINFPNQETCPLLTNLVWRRLLSSFNLSVDELE